MKKIWQSIVILMIMLFGINYVKALEEINNEIPSSISSIDYIAENSTLQKAQNQGTTQKNTSNTASYATVSCGWTDDIPAALPVLTKNVINILKVAVPVILIIMGMLDFGKAVASQDEKGMKETQTRFVKRIIGAIAVFLVITVTQFVFRLLNTSDSNNMLSCIDCFINNNCYQNSRTACYQCVGTDQYIWSISPGTTSACPSGYIRVELSEQECRNHYVEKKCYQCNSNENVYKWSNDGSTDSSCPSGYHERSDITEAGSCYYAESKCYQCNSNGNVYKWDTSNVADSACPSGYHERSDISAQSACHS